MKPILIYDVVSCPLGLDLENVKKIFDEHNTVLWDSSNSGRSPKIIFLKDTDIEFLSIDIKELPLEEQRILIEYISEHGIPRN